MEILVYYVDSTVQNTIHTLILGLRLTDKKVNYNLYFFSPPRRIFRHQESVTVETQRIRFVLVGLFFFFFLFPVKIFATLE